LFPSQQHSETIVAFRGGIFIISVKDLKRFYMCYLTCFPIQSMPKVKVHCSHSMNRT